MTRTFTENDLIRFLYNELDKSETAEIKHALVTDIDLQNQLDELSQTVNQLERVSYSAPKRATDKILAYSKSLLTQSV